MVIGAVTDSEFVPSAVTVACLVQVVAATQTPIHIAKWGVYAGGTTVSAEPIIVDLILQASAGGGGSAAVTPQVIRPRGASVSATANVRFTTLPTAIGLPLDAAEIHPQSGYEVVFPLGDEPEVDGGTSVGIQVFLRDSIGVRAKIWWKE